jgi:DNA-binding HxlR family transcriptional regulator
MALLDLLGRRWALRILWELRTDAPTFRELRSRCDDVSPTVLNERLRDLRVAGLVELRPGGGYGCSPHGAELLESLAPLNRWADAWGRRTRSRSGGHTP